MPEAGRWFARMRWCSPA